MDFCLSLQLCHLNQFLHWLCSCYGSHCTLFNGFQEGSLFFVACEEVTCFCLLTYHLCSFEEFIGILGVRLILIWKWRLSILINQLRVIELKSNLEYLCHINQFVYVNEIINRILNLLNSENTEYVLFFSQKQQQRKRLKKKQLKANKQEKRKGLGFGAFL